MSVSINVNGLTLCHKGDGDGVVTATLPNVCKTPPSQLPVPYPSVAFATDLVDGTVSVAVDGGHMAAHRGSRFACSIGDEPGTGGGVVSGTRGADATWLSFSMDVLLEGQNACRLTDKMLLNHGNTVSMGGFLTAWLVQWLLNARLGNVDCLALLAMINAILNGNKGLGTGPASGMRGLKERFWQQIFGSDPPGTGSWDEHNRLIEDLQAQLREYLNAFTIWCGGSGLSVPSEAWNWATRPAPVASDYRGPQTSTAPSPSTSTQTEPSTPWYDQVDWGDVALYGGATVVGVTATAALLFFPFDGPFGEAATGSGTVYAFGQLISAFGH